MLTGQASAPARVCSGSAFSSATTAFRTALGALATFSQIAAFSTDVPVATRTRT